MTDEQPTLEDYLEARIQMRRQVKSGHPARKAEALRNLLALEGLIRREQIRLARESA